MRALLILYFIDTTTGGLGGSQERASRLGGYLAGMIERIERGESFRLLGGQAGFFLIFVISCLLAACLLGALVPTIRRLMGIWTPGVSRLTDSGLPPARYASAPGGPKPQSHR